MARTQTMVQLNDELIRLLDLEATGRQVSRSAIIREAIELYLSETREREIGNKIREGYVRIPPATPDEWGDLDRIADTAAGELAQRLDAEEREQGVEPW